jgi:hypothetical protein
MRNRQSKHNNTTYLIARYIEDTTDNENSANYNKQQSPTQPIQRHRYLRTSEREREREEEEEKKQ